jgi:hypothetical protein
MNLIDCYLITFQKYWGNFWKNMIDISFTHFPWGFYILFVNLTIIILFRAHLLQLPIYLEAQWHEIIFFCQACSLFIRAGLLTIYSSLCGQDSYQLPRGPSIPLCSKLRS